MDPLSRTLACPCVKGHAQRRYDLLQEYLARRTGGTVRMVHGEALGPAVRTLGGKVDLLIGKTSAIPVFAGRLGLAVTRVAALTDTSGITTLTGLFVVRRSSPIHRLADLRNKTIAFGPEWDSEKSSEAESALERAGVGPQGRRRRAANCNIAAAEVLAGTADAALISSYALSLTVACGVAPEGSLRVLAETSPTPFISAFTTSALSDARRRSVVEALLALSSDAPLCAAMESRYGFILPPTAWSDWRGAQRAGRVAALPTHLTRKPVVAWRQAMVGPGISGIAADESLLIVSDRDEDRGDDIFRCLRTDTGGEIWSRRFRAPGRLENGSAPRATPVLCEDRVVVLGGFGRLSALSRVSGRTFWEHDLRREYAAPLPQWGFCATPLIVGNRVVAVVGAPTGATLVAFDLISGAELWRGAGAAAAYASPIVSPNGQQVIAYDAQSVGGWDLATGQRKWTIQPPKRGDFNVPTPVIAGSDLALSTENNGTRLYALGAGGAPVSPPIASTMALSPDAVTPVVSGDLLLAGRTSLVASRLKDGLKTAWEIRDRAFSTQFVLLTDGSRLLALGLAGDLLLIDGSTPGRIIGRWQVGSRGEAFWSHPAVVGDRLYIRSSRAVLCIDLNACHVKR